MPRSPEGASCKSQGQRPWFTTSKNGQAPKGRKNFRPSYFAPSGLHHLLSLPFQGRRIRRSSVLACGPWLLHDAPSGLSSVSVYREILRLLVVDDDGGG